jgi:hypothetical protein
VRGQSAVQAGKVDGQRTESRGDSNATEVTSHTCAGDR